MKEEINSINALVETDDRCDDGRREVAASVGWGALLGRGGRRPGPRRRTLRLRRGDQHRGRRRREGG